ncbi:GTPase activating protein [Trypanosoma brucei equiperdum]|uniref:GTPase activating protein n=1 Tax=Trypanosoma brucei equiperdum TaxID=630700 RepID=A0A3L6L038_9TRYP|nr:GTPase activating protein [Trypanosoma brucei equiperdum]
MLVATASVTSHGCATDLSTKTRSASVTMEGESVRSDERHHVNVRGDESEGVSVSLLSTRHTVHALNKQSSSAWVTTKLVEQCVTGYRDALLVIREYGHRVEGEGLHLRLQLGEAHRELQSKGGLGASVTHIVEKQLSEHLMQNGNANISPRSASLRHRQILRDMKHLAHGLLIPLDIFRHQHNWLLVQEDVQLSLADRLRHYRVVVRQPPPPALVERLWFDLWALLGAAWRQRGRLLGVYAEGVLPVNVDGGTAVVPPSVLSPPSHREAYREGQREYRSKRMEGSPASGVPADADDCYAFGPITPHRVGIMPSRHYTVRWPLMSILRSLRVRVAGKKPGSESGIRIAMSAGSLGEPKDDHQEESDKCAQTSRGSDFFSPRVSCGSVGGSSQEYPAAFFDLSSEDIETCRVPYLSPECFTQRFRSAGCHSSEPVEVSVSHRFSDDVWNIAVLTIEFMLTNFPLEQSCCHHASYQGFRTSFIFDDIIELLVVYHNIPLRAAQNFVYAALHELSLLVSGVEQVGVDSGEGSVLTPRCLAQQWKDYLSETCSNSTVLREVVTNGLLWLRRERWEVFQTVHSLDDYKEGECGNGSNGCIGGDDNEKNTSSRYGDGAAKRVLDTLVSPYLPLNPALCSAVLREGGEASQGSLSITGSIQQWCEKEDAFWHTQFDDLQSTVQKWRKCIERYTVLGGMSGKGNEARQTVLFKRLVRVVRSVLQLQLEKVKAGDQTKTILLSSDRESRRMQRGEVLSHAVQQELLRGLTERGALFMHILDLVPNQFVPTNSTVAGDDLTRVVPFCGVFMSISHTLSQLEKDMAQLTELSPASTAPFRALDTILGVEYNAARVTHLSACQLNEEADEGKLSMLENVRSVIRQLDLDLKMQVKLVKDMRCLMCTSVPVETRASLVRQYLLRTQAAHGTVEVPIPATLRGEIWAVLLLVSPEPEERASRYFALDTARPTPCNRQLSVDIPRCHQYHPLLASSDGHERMWRIIKAWLLLNPELSYWQGLDSVCAVLLAASFHDEPLVLAQLQELTHNYIPHDLASRETDLPQSMAGKFQLFAVLLRYCDPQLATHLLDTVECGPELFAVGWFLALFAHGLPMAKVFLLWDFLFVYAAVFPHCLAVLCLAVLLQHREQLMSHDFSVCVGALSRARDIEVRIVLYNASLLLRSTPPLVGGPCAPTGQPHSSSNSVPRMRVRTLLQAFRRVPFDETPYGEEWTRNGLFLVDLRETRGGTASLELEGEEQMWSTQRETEERVVGALLFPLVSCQQDGAEIDVMQQELQGRLAVQLASELLSQTRNIALAAVPPVPSSGSRPSAGMRQCEENPAAGTQPEVIARHSECPHIVLFTHSSNLCEVATSELLARELMRCGAPHVSILLGGFVQLKREAADLIVEMVPT